MLGKLIGTEIMNGGMVLIQLMKYSSGKVVKRILDPKTMIPIEIIED